MKKLEVVMQENKDKLLTKNSFNEKAFPTHYSQSALPASIMGSLKATAMLQVTRSQGSTYYSTS